MAARCFRYCSVFLPPFSFFFFAKLSLQNTQSLSVNVHLITCLMEIPGEKWCTSQTPLTSGKTFISATTHNFINANTHTHTDKHTQDTHSQPG